MGADANHWSIETEEAFEQEWRDLCKEFDDQRAILHYRYRIHVPASAQWARCLICHYRNFGTRVTSGTEAEHYVGYQRTPRSLFQQG